MQNNIGWKWLGMTISIALSACGSGSATQEGAAEVSPSITVAKSVIGQWIGTRPVTLLTIERTFSGFYLIYDIADGGKLTAYLLDARDSLDVVLARGGDYQLEGDLLNWQLNTMPKKRHAHIKLDGDSLVLVDDDGTEWPYVHWEHAVSELNILSELNLDSITRIRTHPEVPKTDQQL